MASTLKHYAPAAPVAPAAPAVDEAESLDTRKAINYSVANLGASVFYGLFNFGMPLYLEAYKLPPWLIGLLANERSFIGAFVQPLVGRLSDRLRTPLGRRRPFFLVGVPLVCLGLLLLAMHPTFWVMLGVMSVLAFFLSVAWDPYLAMMADLFTEKQRGRIGGLIGMGTGLGNIIFAGLALWLWASQEFVVFGFVIAVMIVTWAYTFFTVKEPQAAPRPATPPRAKVNWRAYVKGLLRYPVAVRYTLAIMFFWFGTGAVIPFVTLFGENVLGVSKSDAFYLVLAAVISNAIAALPWGFLADRIGKKPVLGIGMTMFGLGAVVGSQSTDLMQGVIAMCFCGAANAATSQITPMLSDIVPKKRMAEFVGLGSSVFSLAQPLGSVFAGGVVMLAAWFYGPVVGAHESYRWAFIYAGAMIITAVILLRSVHPERFVDREDDAEAGAEAAEAGAL